MHFKQETNYSCGAAATRQLLYFCGIELPESFLREKLKTNSKGTYSDNVFSYLKSRLSDREVSSLCQDINFEKESKWLNYISNSNIIYCGGEFINGGKRRGRYGHRHHAFLIYKGEIYDPSESHVFPIDSFGHTYDRELKINSIILVSIDKRMLTN